MIVVSVETTKAAGVLRSAGERLGHWHESSSERNQHQEAGDLTCHVGS